MSLRFITSNPALQPLFIAVGAGIVGGGWYGVHVLRHNQDIIIAKRSTPEPWNNVRQDQNTKLYSPNQEFWSSRTGLEDPRSAFMAAEERAKAKVKEVKARATGH